MSIINSPNSYGSTTNTRMMLGKIAKTHDGGLADNILRSTTVQLENEMHSFRPTFNE
jgi:hypothetical protein